MCTKDQMEQKTYSERTMAAFDAQPIEIRQAIANAPYGMPLRFGMDINAVQNRIAKLLRGRDIARIGPVPTEYKRRKRARR